VGIPGEYAKLEDTIATVRKILDGQFDHLPEEDFYMKGAAISGASA
jgi:F-type H+-transporting ATPase subunit beta